MCPRLLLQGLGAVASSGSTRGTQDHYSRHRRLLSNGVSATCRGRAWGGYHDDNEDNK